MFASCQITFLFTFLMSYFRTNGVGVGSSNFSASSLYFKLKTAKKNILFAPKQNKDHVLRE